MKPSDQWTPEDVARIVTNPIYVGIGPYPAIMDEELFLRCAEKLLNDPGMGGMRGYMKRVIANLREAFPPE